MIFCLLVLHSLVLYNTFVLTFRSVRKVAFHSLVCIVKLLLTEGTKCMQMHRHSGLQSAGAIG